MTEDDYILEVNRILAEHTGTTVLQIREALTMIPEKAKRMTIDIFVDQDGEGALTVRIGLDGPDRHVLNKAISQHAQLFHTRNTPTGFDPALPMMEPDEEEFSVHDVLTDCAARWVAKLWKQHQLTAPIASVVRSPEGYGTITPLTLNS